MQNSEDIIHLGMITCTFSEICIILHIIRYSDIQKSLPRLLLRRLSSKPWPNFRYVSIIETDVFSCIYSSKSRYHPSRKMFCVFLHFFHSGQVRNSAISSLNSRERHFFSSLCRSSLVFNQIYLRSASFPSIYHGIDGTLLASSKYGKRWFVMKNLPEDWSQSETRKYFECIIMPNTSWPDCYATMFKQLIVGRRFIEKC